MEAGPYLLFDTRIGFLRYICGDVKSISAEISNEIYNWEKEDTAAVICVFERSYRHVYHIGSGNFALGLGVCNWRNHEVPYSGQNTLRFMGTKAALRFPNLTLWHHGDREVNWDQEITPYKIKQPLEDAFSLQIQHFAAVILKKEQPLISGLDGRTTLRTTLAQNT